MTHLASEPASVRTEKTSAQDIPATSLAQEMQNHAPDFEFDGEEGWLACTCGAGFPNDLPVHVRRWWEHFNAQLLGLCIACGSNDPDGPIDANGDKFCDACSDAQCRDDAAVHRRDGNALRTQVLPAFTPRLFVPQRHVPQVWKAQG